jgi:hypothetical protein
MLSWSIEVDGPKGLMQTYLRLSFVSFESGPNFLMYIGVLCATYNKFSITKGSNNKFVLTLPASMV